MRSIRRAGLRLISILTLLVWFTPLLAPPAVSLDDHRPARVPQAENGGPIRAVFLYSSDAGGAEAFAELLDGQGFSVQPFQIAGPALHQLWLPLALSGGGEGASDSAPPGSLSDGRARAPLPRAAELPNLSNFDLIIVGADTGLGAAWSTEPEMVDAIRDSGLPVAGLGRGGHAFFGKLTLDIGYPHGEAAEAATVQVADFGDSQPYYTTPNPIAIPGSGVLSLYSSVQSVIGVPLAHRLPEGVRIALLPGEASLYPIVRSSSRYLLWGFESAPPQMTTIGRELYVNALRALAGRLTIPLRSRHILPAAGIEEELLEALSSAERPCLHALVQLNRLPTPEEGEALSSAGVVLVSFLDGLTYVACVEAGVDPEHPAIGALVRWMGQLLPSDKVNPKVQAGDFEEWADNGDGSVNLVVAFFDDVDDEEMDPIVEPYVEGSDYYGEHMLAVVIDQEEIAQLSEEDPVRWIEEGPAPLLPINDNTRSDLHVDEVQGAVTTVSPPFYSGVDGSRVAVGIFDSGINSGSFQHNDFTGRLLRTATETLAPTHSAYGHGTHVAGIVGASGDRSVASCPYTGGCTAFQMRGMAPNVGLAPYHGTNAANMDDAVNNHEIELSNHSYSQTCGDYSNFVQTIDKLVRGELKNGSTAIPAHQIVFAAGNHGDGAQYCTTATLPNGNADPASGLRGYYSITAIAKNALVVGAVARNTNYAVSSLSSRGPTFDGRLKPEVMGVDCGWSTDVDAQGYVFMCGTSMAAPSVTGVLALMVEQFHTSHPGLQRPRPATLRALLVQTATDLVHHPGQAGFTDYTWNDPDSAQPLIFHAGPDWSSGYGVVNAQEAVAAVRGRHFAEGSVSPTNRTDTYTLTVPAGREKLQVTLAWDDEVGDPTKAITATQLVNDLDLTLRSPDGVVVRPWVLGLLPRAANVYNASGVDIGTRDPITRATHVLPAYRGIDRRNNLEQVTVTATTQITPGNWIIQVHAFSLPNNKTQDYGIAGDFRSLNIVDPKTNRVADGGDPATPNVILVQLEAKNGLYGSKSTLQDVALNDFSVSIGGTAAAVVSGLPVGDQYWLNVHPQGGVYTTTQRYDLTVVWDGYGQDSESQAVRFSEREVTDRAIVIDHSGSMSGYDKMAAALSGARLFVDQSLITDRVAIVGFSTVATTTYSITVVSNSGAAPELNAAKSEIDKFTPDMWTAMGKGLLAGQAEVTAAPANHSVYDVIVLLGDGLENIDPKYNTPQVVGVISPTDTIIHTVAVGPAKAGHHKLLAQIAKDTGGTVFHVTSSGGTTSALPRAQGEGSVAATGLDAWPDALGNRVSHAYKQIAETILSENRLFLVKETAGPMGGAHHYDVEVPEGLRRVTFALNWAIHGHILRLVATDADGNEYKHDGVDPLCRTDATHETCIVEEPLPGTWDVAVEFVETGSDNEYVLWASADTLVDFRLVVGTPAAEQTVGEPVHLIGFLHESGEPLPDRSVAVMVYAPGGGQAEVELYDDGAHGDGVGGDGIYANYFVGEEIGSYAVLGRAEGDDLVGRPFTLYTSASFHLMPRALYVYSTDHETAGAFAEWLDANGISTDLAHVDAVPGVEFGRYSLIIIGPETGSATEWGTPEALTAIVNSEVPVLGIGEGGYAYFGQISLEIGYPNGGWSTGTSVDWEHGDDDVWDAPYDIDLSATALQLYVEAGSRVDIYLEPETGVRVLGYKDGDHSYAELVMEDDWRMLWGFADGPGAMTDLGRQLFVNSAHRMLR